MQEYILILKGNNKEFAKLEFENLWLLYKKEKIQLKNLENTIYYFKSKLEIKSNHEIFKRITLTNYFGNILIKGENITDLKNKIKSLNFENLKNKTFLVRNKKSKKDIKTENLEKELAKPIWESLENPKVSLKNPDFEYNFFFFDKENLEIIFSEKIFENKKDYLRRMPKLRPVAMPYTLKSDMARTSVNLLNIKKGKFLDPFCGIGGILLEAYDLGFDVYGNDISEKDLELVKKNFDFFFKNYQINLSNFDSKIQFLRENFIDGIVSDIPYGKCSKKFGENLYEEFLKSAKKYLKKDKRMIIIYANFTEFRKIALKYFKEVETIEEYINKSMTRYILILENNK